MHDDPSQSPSISALLVSGKISEQDIEALEAREQALDAEDSDEITISEATLRAYAEMESQLHQLRMDKAALTAQAAALQQEKAELLSKLPSVAALSCPVHSIATEFQRLIPLLKGRCKPTIIGGSSEHSLPPTVLDVVLQTEPDPVTNFHCGIQTIWIPVRVYPTYVIPPDKPRINLKSGSFPNKIVGQTQIRESLVFPHLIGKDGAPYQIAISGFASLNVHMKPPSDILERYAAQEDLLNAISNQDDSDIPLGVLTDPSATSAFIPSNNPLPSFLSSSLNKPRPAPHPKRTHLKPRPDLPLP